MKAFKSALILFLLGVFLLSHTSVSAQAPQTDYSIKTFHVNQTANQPQFSTQTPNATSTGTVQLLPPGDGKVDINNQNPNNNTYQITKICNPLVGDILSCFGIFGSLIDWLKARIADAIEVVLSVFAKAITGCDTTDVGIFSTCITGYQQNAITPDTNLSQIPKGMIFQLGIISTDLLTTPLPINTATALNQLNPFSQAQAASGFVDLQGANKVFEIWKNARNAAYAFSIIILVAVGFMIMFRTKIDPRTAVSLTNSLPKIVIMLLLITFSYALGGLMIDGVRILSEVLKTIVNLGVSDVAKFYPALLGAALIPIVTLGGGIGAIVGGLIGGAIGIGIASLILILIVAVYILVVEIIVIYHIIIRYAQFIIGLIFAPLIFLATPLPNGSSYILLWFKKELAYLLTIPITIVILAIAFKVAGSCFPSPFGGVLGAVTGNACTLLPGNNPLGLFSFIGPFISLGILSVATKAPTIADELLGNKPITGRGGGGGGGFGLLALASIPVEGVENFGGALKSFNYAQGPMRSFATRGMMKAQGINTPGVPAAHISGQEGALLQKWTGNAAVPTATQLNSLGPDAKAKFDQQFLDVKDKFPNYNAPQVEDMVGRGEYVPLLNDLRGKILMPEINQAGQIAHPRPASFGAQWAGRAFGVNEETIRQNRSKVEKEYISRAIIGGGGGQGRTTPTFGEGTSGDRSPGDETKGSPT